MNVFEKFAQKIAAGAEWLGKVIGEGFSFIPRLITYTEEAKQVASDALTGLVALLDAVGKFVSATAKDGAPFLTAQMGLGADVAKAVAASGLNVMEDEAVLADLKAIVKEFTDGGAADILAAWHALVEAAHSLNQTVLADVKKLASLPAATAPAAPEHAVNTATGQRVTVHAVDPDAPGLMDHAVNTATGQRVMTHVADPDAPPATDHTVNTATGQRTINPNS